MYKKEGYHSYLLRIWLHEAAGKTSWRASLEGTRSGERIGFEDLKALVAFLSLKYPEGEDDLAEQVQEQLD